jgi:hypothetical protein
MADGCLHRLSVRSTSSRVHPCPPLLVGGALAPVFLVDGADPICLYSWSSRWSCIGSGGASIRACSGGSRTCVCGRPSPREKFLGYYYPFFFPLSPWEISRVLLSLFLSSPYLQTVYNDAFIFVHLPRYDASCRSTVPHTPAAIPLPACASWFAFFFAFPPPLPFPTHLVSVSFTIPFLRRLLSTITVS